MIVVSNVSHKFKFNEAFSVQIKVHLCIVLSLIQVITEKFKTNSPWDLLCAYNLVNLAKSVKKKKKISTMVLKFKKKIKVNLTTTKVLVSKQKEQVGILYGLANVTYRWIKDAVGSQAGWQKQTSYRADA